MPIILGSIRNLAWNVCISSCIILCHWYQCISIQWWISHVETLTFFGNANLLLLFSLIIGKKVWSDVDGEKQSLSLFLLISKWILLSDVNVSEPTGTLIFQLGTSFPVMEPPLDRVNCWGSHPRTVFGSHFIYPHFPLSVGNRFFQWCISSTCSGAVRVGMSQCIQQALPLPTGVLVVQWDPIFFSSCECIPLERVYKNIEFRKGKEMKCIWEMCYFVEAVQLRTLEVL